MQTLSALITLAIASGSGLIGGFGLLLLAYCWTKSIVQPLVGPPHGQSEAIRNPRSLDNLVWSARIMIVTGCVVIALSFLVAWIGVLLMLWNGHLWFDR